MIDCFLMEKANTGQYQRPQELLPPGQKENIILPKGKVRIDYLNPVLG